MNSDYKAMSEGPKAGKKKKIEQKVKTMAKNKLKFESSDDPKIEFKIPNVFFKVKNYFLYRFTF